MSIREAITIADFGVDFARIPAVIWENLRVDLPTNDDVHSGSQGLLRVGGCPEGLAISYWVLFTSWVG